MKFAPKSFMIFLCLSILVWSCRHDVNPHKATDDDTKNEVPQEEPQDSSQLDQPSLAPAPDSNPANKAKKKSRSQLDTLRPIKA